MRNCTRPTPGILLMLAGILTYATPAIADTSGNQPHGSGGQCTLSQQQTELSTLSTALGTLVGGVSTATGKDTRDLTNGALANYYTSTVTSTTVYSWLETAYARLDTTHGNNVWFTVGSSSSSNDPNASEFATLGMGSIFASGKMTFSALKADSALGNTGTTSGTVAYNNLLLVMGALVLHTAGSTPSIPVSYTNMYLMNTTDRILMDQALIAASLGSASFGITTSPYNTTDNNATQDLPIAKAQMNTWLTTVKGGGIHEFDSPTYSGTQMESLVEGYNYISDTNTKANYKSALDYLWLDLAANFFTGNIRVNAPFARDYDFRAGQGAAQGWIEVLGCWTTGTATSGTYLITSSGLTLETAELLDILESATGYQLESSTYNLATTGSQSGTPPSNKELNVFQKWGTETNGTATPIRTNTIFTNVDIGCTGGNYGPQDKLFSVGLSGQKTSGKYNRSLALISNVLDSSGNPYGTTTSLDKDGEAKPEHLQENEACAEAKGAALLTMFVDPSQRDSTDTGLSTNILFPFDTTYSGGSGTNPTYPTVAINLVPMATILASPVTYGCSGGNNALSNYILSCPLTMNNSVVTFTGINGGVVGVKFAESSWTDSGVTIPYQLEIDYSGSPANPSGGSNAASRIALTHSVTPLSGEGTLPSYIRVGLEVATGDSDTDPTRVYNILKNAAYSDNSGTGIRTITTAFASSYQPYTAAVPTNYLSSLEVVRSSSTLTDPGTPDEIINTGSWVSTYPSSTLCTNMNLLSLNGSGAATCLADGFWAERAHTIH